MIDVDRLAETNTNAQGVLDYPRFKAVRVRAERVLGTLSSANTHSGPLQLLA